ncbi:putative sparagine synthase [Pseudomonas aeruginosa VRFPA02]|nr:putative sparagine synthase [Pseudomonas aeruginosa VRFPA02]
MCGILGYVGTGFSVSRFAGALRLLAHRGPFGEGIAALPNGAIGMTRLPMSGAAAVPLPPQEGQRRVAYNGEVYQASCEIHGEIRLLLDGLQRGVLPDGMYALASWDPQTRQLTLLRDEFGIKPLYYSYQPERGLLAFASEPRALLHLLGGEYRRKAALLAEPAGRRVAERIEELAHEALGQGLEAAIGQFDLHYSLEPLLRRADHLLMSRTIEARTPYLHGALAQRAGRLQRIVGDTAKAPLVALLEQREKRWQAQPKRHFRLPFERWPQALGEMRRHLAERLPALHDLGLEGLDAPSVAALPGDQLFTLTTLSLWQQEYGASL